MIWLKFRVFVKNFTTYLKKTVSILKDYKNQRKYLKTETGFFSHYKQLFDRFYFNLFRQLVPYVPIENLHDF